MHNFDPRKKKFGKRIPLQTLYAKNTACVSISPPDRRRMGLDGVGRTRADGMMNPLLLGRGELTLLGAHFDRPQEMWVEALNGDGRRGDTQRHQIITRY